jgi:transposase-like protein
MKRYQKPYKTINQNSDAAVTLRVNMDAVVDEVGAGMRRLGEEAALRVMEIAMERERQRLVDEGAGYRHGSQPGRVVVDGRKITAPHLRVRGRCGEIPLETYHAFQNADEVSARAYSAMIRGMSARDYQRAAREFASGYGLSKTAVDANFMREADEKLRQLLERDLSGLDITAIFMDGKGFGDTMIIAAIGVCSDGQKVALGIWQGTTENAVVCQSLLKDLTRRGLDAAKPYLFIIDGGKGLRAAILAVFGGNAFVQRCQEHKQRNVKEHLPDALQPEYRRKLTAAYGMASYDGALSALTDCVTELYRVNPSAARSLEEGLEETLTLHRLGLPDELRKSLRTTNCIESAFSQVGYRTGRVKRWRDGAQVQRWSGCALLMAEERWHKVSGWRLLGHLREAMNRLREERKDRETRELNLTTGG